MFVQRQEPEATPRKTSFPLGLGCVFAKRPYGLSEGVENPPPPQKKNLAEPQVRLAEKHPFPEESTEPTM